MKRYENDIRSQIHVTGNWAQKDAYWQKIRNGWITLLNAFIVLLILDIIIIMKMSLNSRDKK